MNLTWCFYRPWARPAIVLWTLGLLGAVVLGGEDRRPAAKPDAKGVAKMVDAIANHNKPPKIVRRPRDAWPETVALYPEGYDWKEEERVHRALDELYADTTAELWEELLRRLDDERYCLVDVSPSSEDAYIESVGSACGDLAYARLVDVIREHLPRDPNHEPYRLSLPVGFRQVNLAAWRKERAKKSLYELQIEVCEAALRDLAKVQGVSKAEQAAARRKAEVQGVLEAEKTAARQKLEAEIAKLRRTKRPHLRKLDYPGLTYDAEVAKRVREAVQRGSSEEIRITR
jgi:hypothetical protein